MTTGLILGGGLGAALCLLVFALVPPRPAIAGKVGRWERARARQAEIGRGVEGWQGSTGRWLVVQLAARGLTFSRLRADLELNDSSLEKHLVRKVTYGLLGLLVPSMLTVLLLMGGITPPWTVPAVGGAVFGALMFWLPDLSVRKDADHRRHELRRALACYLDLVSMSLSGGRGIPEALPTAARIGTGWAFELLRSTIDHARLVGDTPWKALADLGKRTGMQELQDLGGALILVAEDGSKVRQSLTARAGTQRKRQLAEAEGAAAKADQSMEMAQIVLVIGFLLFLGFPALVAVMGI